MPVFHATVVRVAISVSFVAFGMGAPFIVASFSPDEATNANNATNGTANNTFAASPPATTLAPFGTLSSTEPTGAPSITPAAPTSTVSSSSTSSPATLASTKPSPTGSLATSSAATTQASSTASTASTASSGKPSSTTTSTSKPKPAVTTTTTTTTTQPKPKPMDLRSAQTRLLANGYWLSAANGTKDFTTTQALYTFQKINRLPVTGTLDLATSNVLERATRPSATSGLANGIEIDKSRQVLFVVRNSSVLWAINTSTGSGIPYTENGITGSAQTPSGTFPVLRDVNGVDDGPLGNLFRPKYFTWSGIAIHGAASVPPYPASHGCARVSNAAMDMIWSQNLAPKGSTVVVK